MVCVSLRDVRRRPLGGVEVDISGDVLTGQ